MPLGGTLCRSFAYFQTKKLLYSIQDHKFEQSNYFTNMDEIKFPLQRQQQKIKTDSLCTKEDQPNNFEFT